MYASVNRVSISSDNGLSPIRRQAIFWTSAGLLSIGPLGTNFSEILIIIQNFSFTKCTWKYRLWKGGHFVQGGWVYFGEFWMNVSWKCRNEIRLILYYTDFSYHLNTISSTAYDLTGKSQYQLLATTHISCNVLCYFRYWRNIFVWQHRYLCLYLLSSLMKFSLINVLW